MALKKRGQGAKHYRKKFILEDGYGNRDPRGWRGRYTHHINPYWPALRRLRFKYD